MTIYHAASSFSESSASFCAVHSPSSTWSTDFATTTFVLVWVITVSVHGGLVALCANGSGTAVPVAATWCGSRCIEPSEDVSSVRMSTLFILCVGRWANAATAYVPHCVNAATAYFPKLFTHVQRQSASAVVQWLKELQTVAVGAMKNSSPRVVQPLGNAAVLWVKHLAVVVKALGNAVVVAVKALGNAVVLSAQPLATVVVGSVTIS